MIRLTRMRCRYGKKKNFMVNGYLVKPLLGVAVVIGVCFINLIYEIILQIRKILARFFQNPQYHIRINPIGGNNNKFTVIIALLQKRPRKEKVRTRGKLSIGLVLFKVRHQFSIDIAFLNLFIILFAQTG